MKNWKSILLLALVFLAGMAVGVVGTRIAVRHAVQQAVGHPERAQLVMERVLTRRLGLDREQQRQLHAILTETREQMTALRKEYQPRTSALLHDTDQKISALLTPEQQTRYEKIKARTWPALRQLPPPPQGP